MAPCLADLAMLLHPSLVVVNHCFVLSIDNHSFYQNDG
jgi:hypothetical protein